MSSTIESKTADTILQRPKVVKLPWGEVEAPRPTIATLILVSEAISHLPEIDRDGGPVVSSLRYARNASPLGEIAALLLLGAKDTCETVTVRSFPLFWRKKTVVRDKVKPLAKRILNELTPAEVNNLLAEILSDMQLGDFFAITTFLTGINLTKKTKVEEQTQSGRQ